MIAYVISDVHVDFYVRQSKVYADQEPGFQKFFESHFLPADVLLLAGDIANDYYTQVGFLRFLSGKYKEIYVVYGNHDLLVKNNTTMGNGNPFKKSIDRMDRVVSEMAAYPNVHVLEGSVSNGIGGCMGFADFMYGNAPGTSMYYWERNFIDSRGWDFKRNRADLITTYYMEMISSVIAQKPRIMMTHYCPVEMGVAERFANDPFTPCFYFNGARFMESGGPGIWICGHTHDQYDTDWTDANGMHHRILCNPVGYPSDRNAFRECYRDKKFLIEI